MAILLNTDNSQELTSKYRMARHIKRGDMVMVIAGADRAETGKVLRVITDKDRVVVEGINRVWKHVKPQPAEPAGRPHPEGAPIHISNVHAAGSDRPARERGCGSRCATARSTASRSQAGPILGRLGKAEQVARSVRSSELARVESCRVRTED